MAREKDTNIFRFLDGKGVYKSAIKQNTRGRGGLGRNVWIVDMWPVRFQGFPSEVAHLQLPVRWDLTKKSRIERVTWKSAAYPWAVEKKDERTE